MPEKRVRFSVHEELNFSRVLAVADSNIVPLVIRDGLASPKSSDPADIQGQVAFLHEPGQTVRNPLGLVGGLGHDRAPMIGLDARLQGEVPRA